MLIIQILIITNLKNENTHTSSKIKNILAVILRRLHRVRGLDNFCAVYKVVSECLELNKHFTILINGIF